ncbi:Uncharacterised protein [Actinobacillus lignieresii]|uniref:hypothetical protein n=1 Tax=Actinobacillus lignieresii TaxID=720 RepID=UPI000E19797A|nr:hypothetical protein [Actinobacillus lignieresii]SUT96288.1 Uncharacterised protein [Actinobacillus lignieresii]VEB25720.1 Uncharacterised protein [Actinobacillus lignieresii]
MKKLLAIALSCISIAGHAETKAPTMQPMLKLQVLDMSNKVGRAVENNKLSLSKTHQLCWVAFNMPFKATNEVVEIFKSPAPSKFGSAAGSVSTSADRLTHKITTRMPSSNNERVDNCWRFEKSDPKGKYSLTIQVNDIIFPPQTFEVTK